MQLGNFFSGEQREFCLSQRFCFWILAADELRSHVTIILRDKSRCDLIVNINEKA